MGTPRLTLLISPFLILLVSSQATSRQLPTDDPAHQEAKNRQALVKTAEIVFEQQEVIPAGGMSQASPGATQKTLPQQETRLSSKNRLLIDGTQCRYEKNHPVWSEVTHTFNDNHIISVLNAKGATRWFTNGIGKSGVPQGAITSNATNPDIKGYAIEPITLSFRGLTPEISAYMVSSLRRSSHSTRVREQDCSEYTLPVSKDVNRHYYLAPKLRHQLVRMHTVNRGKVVSQIDVDYKEHADLGVVPAKWTRLDYTASGVLWRSSTVIVTNLLINQASLPGAFTVTFPPGAYVYDQDTGFDYRVRDDGRMQKISSSGEELDEIIEQPAAPWYRRVFYNPIIIAALLVRVVCMLVIRRERRRAP
jgi:hypothetical protein